MTTRTPLLALALLAAPLSCVAYNEQCQGLVTNPEEEIAQIGEVIYLAKPNLRHDNNALAQALAESFVAAFRGTSTPAVVGMINGGGIRSEGLCVPRTVLRPGPLTNGLLHELLPFDNLVTAVDLTEEELFRVLEHSVARLTPVQPIVNPAGSFLQLAGAQLTVDCNRPVGDRVTNLILQPEGGAPRTLTKPGRADAMVRVATTAFLLGGGDGYVDLEGKATDATRNPLQAQIGGGTEANVAAEWMRERYLVPSPSAPDALRVDATRIKLENCARPGPPET
jgi:2',3'-cyclic-nucleotide 2'-phosphodiesterase (5'-nucleotidase family)